MMRRRHRLLFAVGLVVVLSGCAAHAPAASTSDDGRLGWENGYGANASIAVTPEDGFNASEREALLARTMARLETLRELEFTESVSIRIETREQFRANQSGDTNRTYAAWNNQVWEALFLVGGDADVEEVFDEAFGTRVLGYYQPGSDEVVIVSDSETPTIPRSTLVHELVHALQDQRFDIADQPPTQDRQLARNGVIEGEANRLQVAYARTCGEEWDCIPPGGGGGGGDLGPYGENVFSVIYHPYASGPDFVGAIAERAGTDALNALYDPYPASTEQIIHPERYPEDTPLNVTVPDRSAGDWRRFDHDPVADTVGEASIFAMVRTHALGDTRVGRFSYDHPVSEGWAGDTLVPYRDGDRFGYVWRTAWDTRADAEAFHAAYRELMADQGAESLGDGRYRLPADHPYGGSFRLSIEDRRVTVVHGPTRASLDRIHAP
jgi:hypothetical protein